MSEVARALELFSEAVARDPAARAVYLDAACAGDGALRLQVERMLAADACSDHFLEQPLGRGPVERSGELLGAYRLETLLGSGGMGSVYRATRSDGAFDKPVAIKLLLFDAGDLRERFLRERRILGHLSHVNIATLLDVGNDAHGAPYFVMEYIDGLPITEYVRAQALDLRARVALFLPILDAVQSAHSQLIVHRDIKPGNVLIDRQGVPKLLDFGIAKVLDAAAVARTRTGLAPLTPEYASPEQIRGEHVGVASDVYSLGVLLFECITGRSPYVFADQRPSTIERVICESWPPPPTTLLAALPRGGNLRDLDAVLLRALEKRPQQRYRSCAEFADDIRRWLAGDSVLARTPSRRERVQRFVRRYRLAVGAGSAIVAALLLGSGVALWQAQLARAQARIATYERDRAQRVNRFLSDTLGAANPSDLGRNATVVDVLARARRLADQDLGSDPATAASTQLVLSGTYRALADYSAARDCAERARSLLDGSNDTGLKIEADLALASAQYDLGDYRSAAVGATKARAQAEQGGSALQRGDTASLLGEIALQSGDTARAFAWFDRALVEFPSQAIEDRADVLANYGAAAHQHGDEETSLAKYREGIALLAQAHADATPSGIALYGNMAAALRANGRVEEAITVLTTHVLPQQVEVLGENAPDVVWTLTNLAAMSYEHKDIDAMLAYALRAYRISEHLPDENQWKVAAIKRYGLSLIRSDRAREAIPVLERARSLAAAIFPPDNFNRSSLDSWLGLALSLSGERTRGEPLARDAYQRLLAKYGEKYEVTMSAKKNIEQIEALPAMP